MFILKNGKEETVRHFWLYVIVLEQGKYYVGITTHHDPFIRLRQHGGSYGASWTKKYKPLEPIKPELLKDLGVVTQVEAERGEQDAFKEYSAKYGLRNVRGGRVVSTGRIYRIGQFYFNQSMLEGLGVALLLFACSLYILLHH